MTEENNNNNIAQQDDIDYGSMDKVKSSSGDVIIIERKRSEVTHIRIQKSRNGKFVMCVLVWFDKEKKKHQRYFSIPFFLLHTYITGQTASFYVNAEEMIPKDDPRYAKYIERRNKNREKMKLNMSLNHKSKGGVLKNKIQQNNNDIKQNDEVKTANDPISLRFPLNLK